MPVHGSYVRAAVWAAAAALAAAAAACWACAAVKIKIDLKQFDWKLKPERTEIWQQLPCAALVEWTAVKEFIFNLVNKMVF